MPPFRIIFTLALTLEGLFTTDIKGIRMILRRGCEADELSKIDSKMCFWKI